MKESTVLIIVGIAAVLFWAVSTGFLKVTGGPVTVGPQGQISGVVSPQPASNYSGFLAASTAPGVSGLLNNVMSGLSGAFGSWINPASGNNTTTGQGSNPSSPSRAAQPAGPVGVQPSVYSPNASLVAPVSGAPTAQLSGFLPSVGPQVDASLSYDATSGGAFDYSGLAADNAFDPTYSLESV